MCVGLSLGFLSCSIDLYFCFCASTILSFFLNLFLAVLGLRCCVQAFSGCGERGLLFIAVHRLLIAVASLVVEHGLQARGLQQLQHVGFSSCSMWAQQLWLVGSRAQAQQLWCMGLVAPRHVGSSRTRAQTCVTCSGRRILNYCATREVPYCLDYCSFVVQSEVREPDSSSSVFPSQDCFGYSGSFVFPYKL